MERKISTRDLPLNEITLRKYESPKGMDKKELCRKFLLSLGLLQPGESRDIIADIFYLIARTSSELSIEIIAKNLNGKAGASEPNIRRQIRRLKEMKLIEKHANGYRLVENGLIEESIKNYVVPFIVSPSTERILEYARELDSFIIKK